MFRLLAGQFIVRRPFPRPASARGVQHAGELETVSSDWLFVLLGYFSATKLASDVLEDLSMFGYRYQLLQGRSRTIVSGVENAEGTGNRLTRVSPARRRSCYDAGSGRKGLCMGRPCMGSSLTEMEDDHFVLFFVFFAPLLVLSIGVFVNPLF